MVGPKGGGGELETFGREAEHKSLLPSTTTGLAAGGPPLCANGQARSGPSFAPSCLRGRSLLPRLLRPGG